MGGVAGTVDTAAYEAWQRKLDARRKQAGKATVANPFVHYSVPCVRLTALLTALHLPRVDIMWLDVEGALGTLSHAARLSLRREAYRAAAKLGSSVSVCVCVCVCTSARMGTGRASTRALTCLRALVCTLTYRTCAVRGTPHLSPSPAPSPHTTPHHPLQARS